MPSQCHVGLSTPSPSQVTNALQELLHVSVNVGKHKNKLQEYLISFYSGMRRPERSISSSLSARTCNQPQHGTWAKRLCKTLVSNGGITSLCCESGAWDSLWEQKRSSKKSRQLPKHTCRGKGLTAWHSWDTPAPFPASTAAEGAPASGDRSQQRPVCAWSKCLSRGQASPSVSPVVQRNAQSQPRQDRAVLAHHTAMAKQAFCRPGCLLPAFCLGSICCGVSFCCF